MKNLIIIVMLAVSFNLLHAQTGWNEVAVFENMPETISDFEIEGNYLVVSGSFVDAFIDVYNISNTSNPVLEKRVEMEDTDISDLHIDNGTLYAAGEDGLIIFDFSDPVNFTQTNHIEEVMDGADAKAISTWAFEKSGNVAFVESGWSGLMAFDISDPSSPNYYDIEGHMGITEDIEYIDANTLALVDGYSLYFLDYSTVTDLSDEVVDISGDPTSVVMGANQNYVYVISETYAPSVYLTVVEISSHNIITEITLPESISRAADIECRDNKLYIATNNGFAIYDISTATNPVLIETVETDHYSPNEDAIATIPNYVFGGSYDKFIVYSNQVSSINTRSSHGISVYPNPTDDICTIQGISQPVDIWIYDICGNIVKKVEVVKTVNLSELTPGVYFLQIDTGAGRVTKQIIKK